MDILGEFRKLPTGDTTDWLMLPYGARGLLLQLWRKVGHDGRLELGRHGLRGITAHVGSFSDWPAIEGDLAELLRAGAVIHHEAAAQLEVVGFVESQGAYARTRAAERMRRVREQGKAKAEPEANACEHVHQEANACEPVRTCSTEERRREEKREDPPKSPKGPDTAESKAMPQAQDDDSALAAWEAIQAGAGSPQALGLARNYGQLNGTWLDDNKASLWARNWSTLRALERPPTLTLCEKLGRWLVAGQKPIPSPWQCLAKGGNHANVGAWFDQAEEWDGVSDPRARPAAPRAPPPEPDYPAHRPMEQTAAQRRKRELEAEARAAAEPKKP